MSLVNYICLFLLGFFILWYIFLREKIGRDFFNFLFIKVNFKNYYYKNINYFIEIFDWVVKKSISKLIYFFNIILWKFWIYIKVEREKLILIFKNVKKYIY